MSRQASRLDAKKVVSKLNAKWKIEHSRLLACKISYLFLVVVLSTEPFEVPPTLKIGFTFAFAVSAGV